MMLNTKFQKEPIYWILTVHYNNIFATFGELAIKDIDKALEGNGCGCINNIIQNLINTYSFATVMRFHMKFFEYREVV